MNITKNKAWAAYKKIQEQAWAAYEKLQEKGN